MSDGRTAEMEGGCPAPEKLWDTIEGNLPVAQRRKIVDHLVECPSCVEAWRLARSIGAEPPSLRRTLRRLLERKPWKRADPGGVAGTPTPSEIETETTERSEIGAHRKEQNLSISDQFKKWMDAIDVQIAELSVRVADLEEGGGTPPQGWEWEFLEDRTIISHPWWTATMEEPTLSVPLDPQEENRAKREIKEIRMSLDYVAPVDWTHEHAGPSLSWIVGPDRWWKGLAWSCTAYLKSGLPRLRMNSTIRHPLTAQLPTTLEVKWSPGVVVEESTASRIGSLQSIPDGSTWNIGNSINDKEDSSVGWQFRVVLTLVY